MIPIREALVILVMAVRAQFGPLFYLPSESAEWPRPLGEPVPDDEPLRRLCSQHEIELIQRKGSRNNSDNRNLTARALSAQSATKRDLAITKCLFATNSLESLNNDMPCREV